MISGRTRAVAIVASVVVGIGVLAFLRWPSSRPALDCPPSEVTLGPDGVARCGPGAPLPAGQKLTLGAPLDLNHASAADLAQLPGVGDRLAQAIIDERERLKGFRSWDQLDAVPGVGPAKLETLKAAVEIR